MPSLLYDLAVRLSFTAPALGAAVSQAMSQMSGFAKAVTSAQTELDRLAKQQARMPQVMYAHAAATDAVTNAHIRLSNAQAVLNNLGPNASPDAVARAAQRADIAQRSFDLSQMRLAKTADPAVVQAQITSGVAQAQRQLADAQAAQQNANDAQGRMIMGAALTGVGATEFGWVKDWVSSAMAMQVSMEKVSLATTGTTASMQQLEDKAQEVAAHVQMSSTQVMDIARLAATSGFNDRGQLLQSLPTLANVAEVAQQFRGISPQASVPEFVQMAHLFQQYGAKPGMSFKEANGANASFNDMLNLAARSLLVSGATPQAMMRMMSYMSGAQHEFNLKPEQVIEFASLATNVGLTSGRGGGSRIAALFQRLIPTGSRKHDQALAELESASGGRFFTPSGALAGGTTGDPMINVIQLLSQAARSIKNGEDRAKIFYDVFGAGGVNAATALGNQGAVSRAVQLMEQLGLSGPNALKDVPQMQQGLAATVAGNMNVFRTNLNSISQILGDSLLPTLNMFSTGLMNVSGMLLSFFQHNRALAELVAVTVAVSAVLTTLTGVVLTLMGVAALLDLSFGGLIIEIGLIIWPITLIAAAIATVVVIITNWGTIMRGLGTIIGDVMSAFQAFLRWLGGLTLPGGSHPFALAGIYGNIGREEVKVGDKYVNMPAGSKSYPYDSGTTTYNLPIKHNKAGYYVTLPPKSRKGVNAGSGGGVGAPITVNNHFNLTHDVPDSTIEKIKHHVGESVSNALRDSMRYDAQTGLALEPGYR